MQERLVREDRAHAALVFDGDEAVAWVQFGPAGELPNIHHRKEYEESLDKLPDYRITCIFVDKKCRRKGVTAVALRGAFNLIAKRGGGTVEGYPHDTTDGKKVSVLYNATRALYEEAGIEYVRPKGKRNCVMRQVCANVLRSKAVEFGWESVRECSGRSCAPIGRGEQACASVRE